MLPRQPSRRQDHLTGSRFRSCSAIEAAHLAGALDDIEGIPRIC